MALRSETRSPSWRSRNPVAYPHRASGGAITHSTRREARLVSGGTVLDGSIRARSAKRDGLAQPGKARARKDRIEVVVQRDLARGNARIDGREPLCGYTKPPIQLQRDHGSGRWVLSGIDSDNAHAIQPESNPRHRVGRARGPQRCAS